MMTSKVEGRLSSGKWAITVRGRGISPAPFRSLMATGYAAVIFDVGGVLVSPPQAAILAYEEEIKVPQ